MMSLTGTAEVGTSSRGRERREMTTNVLDVTTMQIIGGGTTTDAPVVGTILIDIIGIDRRLTNDLNESMLEYHHSRSFDLISLCDNRKC